MNFLKSILATLLALVIFSLISLFLLVGLASSLGEEEPVTVEANSILHLDLNKRITELEIENPLEKLEVFGGETSSIGLVKLKEAIAQAASDPNISGIYMNVGYFSGGMATLEEVRNSLMEFKNSGKFVVAYSEYYSEGAYYLASVADKVYLNPEGELELNGLNANVTFYKGMLDKFGVEAQIFRVGDYKSAVEPFMRKDLSEENELQMKELMTNINDVMLSGIASSREINYDRLQEISKNMEVREAEDALKLKLIDNLFYDDQVRNELKDMANASELEFIGYDDYKKSYSNYKATTNKIAVIVAAGDIVSGKGEDETVGSDKFAKLIREAREDESVKAIVLRVNSLGGSFLASDVMWRELELAAQTKPLIASMSDYATSGGYYLSMPCDTIVAQPNTITGSIGIFGMLFNFSGLLEDRLGITHDEVQTGEFSGMITVTRSLTDAEKNIIQKSLEKNYDTFITKAAQGRSMTKEELEKLASGRVWSGSKAHELGLVDVLGSFDDAVAIAAQKAGVADDYKLRFYPEEKPFFEKLMNDFGAEASTRVFSDQPLDVVSTSKQVKRVLNISGSQARWPFEFQIN